MPTTVPGVSTSMRSTPDIVKQGIYEVSATQLHQLGARLEIGDGRVFHYAKNGGVALSPAKMSEGEGPLATHLKCAVAAAAAVGDMRVKVTLGAAAAALNDYAEGYLNVDSVGGGFTTYKVKDHLAIGVGGTGYFNLFDPVQVALTAAHKVTLTKNPWKDVVVAPAAAAQAQMPTGINLITVPIANYFWCQTWGPAGCLLGAGPPVISDLLMTSAATPGALIVYAVTASRTPCAILMRAEVATDYGLVFLTIAP